MIIDKLLFCEFVYNHIFVKIYNYISFVISLRDYMIN